MTGSLYFAPIDSTFGISTFKIDKIFVSILKDFTFNEYNVKVCKNAFAYLLIVHNTLSLSRHEQVSLMRLRFERYLSHHQAIEMIIFGTFMQNMQTWMETIELTDLGEKKLCNATSYTN